MAFLLFALHKLAMSMNQFQQMASRNLVCNCFLFIFHCFLPMDTLDTFEVPCTAEQSLLGTILLVPLNCKAALDQNRLQNSWFLAKRCFTITSMCPSTFFGSPLCNIIFFFRLILMIPSWQGHHFVRSVSLDDKLTLGTIKKRAVLMLLTVSQGPIIIFWYCNPSTRPWVHTCVCEIFFYPNKTFGTRGRSC